MHNFSSSTAELLMEAGHDSLNKMQSVVASNLVTIKGIEEKTANMIETGMASKKQLIQKLLEVGVTIQGPKKIESKSNTLSGLSFCFTGAIQKVDDSGVRYTRDMMQNLVKENGGKAHSRVSTDLTYLVMADPNSTSSKAQKARKYEVTLLSEEDFFKMIG